MHVVSSRGVNNGCCHTQGCRDISQMWHRYCLLLCPEFILCAPKAEVDKDQGNVYLETQKQSTPPFLHVKQPFCFFSF